MQYKLQKFAFKSPVHACDSNSFPPGKRPCAGQAGPELFGSTVLREGKRCGVGSRASGWQQLLKNDTCYFIGGTL